MSYLTYSEKLLDPQWQRKRLEVLNRDQFKCCLCSDTKTTLHIHHKTYEKGKLPWQYKLDNFQTLCKHCHLLAEFFKNEKETKLYENIIKNVELIIKLNIDIKITNLQSDIDQIRYRISYCEDSINKNVYELYELSEEEIKVIEEN